MSSTHRCPPLYAGRFAERSPFASAQQAAGAAGPVYPGVMVGDRLEGSLEEAAAYRRSIREDRGADRRRDQHRVRHPRLPRAERRVDHEARVDEAREHRGLRARSAGARPGVAGADAPPGVDGAAERRAPRARRAGAPRHAARADDPEHRRAPPGGRLRAGARAARDDPPGEVPVVRPPHADAGAARSRPRRRARPRVHRVRRHPEVGDGGVRRAPRSARARDGGRGLERVRPVPRDRDDAHRAAGRDARRRCPPARRAIGHREPGRDAARRPSRRCRSATPIGEVLPAIVRQGERTS